ncbi:amidohydrolase [Moniliophthora roreri MCA 2997]|uniref:Amidohydrolase n=1 Tax=Moniliophthora roreri (strain MCA 2997) TaxID=1381753 RepID=V2WYV9_MONRO|nr:amidohydrolase [Moniliophthora roreri MCA 2997]
MSFKCDSPQPRKSLTITSSSLWCTQLRPFPKVLILSVALVLTSLLYPKVSYHRRTLAEEDLASEWHDDMPYREQAWWDISTEYPYPRVLEYQVNEGTWLRLDIHPNSGDVVFDILGDLYCIPGTEAYDFHDESTRRARPILLGIPYDSDPRFSPRGDLLAFRSDAELGVDNLWVLPWKGCDAMDVRPISKDRVLASALELKSTEDELLAKGVKETEERKHRRLIREGRINAQRITNETWRYVSGPRFYPSGSKVIGTKWYQGRVTLGAPEGWVYPLPASIPQSIPVGSGKRVIGRTLPPGRTIEEYANLQIGPEQFTFNGEDVLIYAKNIVDSYTTTENKDPFKGTYGIFSRNLTTGLESVLVDGSPGGAVRPEISRDGCTLAFVRRSRDHGVLVLKDLTTGTIHHVWNGLSTEFSTSWSSISGSYPSFAFTPSDDAVVIWARGQIHHIPLSVNERGERVVGGVPRPIRFSATIEQRIAETITAEVDLVGLETQDTQRVHAFKELRVDESGSQAVFQAAGVTVVQVIGEHNVTKVPVLDQTSPYYSPSFVPGANHLVLHAKWSDTGLTTFELADIQTGVACELTGLPLGRYFSPVLSQSNNTTRYIAFIKSDGDLLTGSIIATANPGIYVGSVNLPPNASSSTQIPISDIRFVSSSVDTTAFKEILLDFLSDSELMVQYTDQTFTIDLSAGTNADGEYDIQTVTTAKVSTEIASTSSAVRDYDAFVENSHVYLAARKDAKDIPLWAKPGNSTKGLARLSAHGGHSIIWSRDFKKLFWLLGPILHSFEVSKLGQCVRQIRQDPETFGAKCLDKLVEQQEISVSHSTDIARFKEETKTTEGSDKILAIINAKIMTMENGVEEHDLIQNGILLVKDGLISAVGDSSSVRIHANTTTIDAQGAFVIPGFFDAHAHWSGPIFRFPAKSWEMQAFLAYGVTSMHNPSSMTVNTFIERSRLESDQFVGPRVLTTGSPLFAGTWTGLHEEIADEEQAYSALYRIKAEGGPISHSYKNYQLPSRASRQRLLKAARKLGMLCVPEGGANWDWGLTYIIDGMTTHEHNLPVPVIYDDVAQLFAHSGTVYTPTHLVHYGGLLGEVHVWANHDVPNDPKLRKYVPHDILEGLTESIAAPSYAYTLFNVSASAARMSRLGVPLHIGAHGENPKGHNYHAEMFFAKQGGLSNYEVLKAAITTGPQTFGLFASIGSLTPGKLADFLIYQPGIDLLDGPIENTRALRFVARGGRIWDASSMNEVWPVARDAQTMPVFNP